MEPWRKTGIIITLIIAFSFAFYILCWLIKPFLNKILLEISGESAKIYLGGLASGVPLGIAGCSVPRRILNAIKRFVE